MSGFTEEAFVVKNLDTGESFRLDETTEAEEKKKKKKKTLDDCIAQLSTFAKEGAAREMRATIASVETCAGFDGKPYTMYALDVALCRGYVGETALMKKWQVRRRFRDFVSLESELIAEGYEFALKGVSLPSKHYWGSMSESVVRSRMLALGAYLNAVLSVLDGKIRSVEALCGFLTVPRELCERKNRNAAAATASASSANNSAVLLTLAEAARKYPQICS